MIIGIGLLLTLLLAVWFLLWAIKSFTTVGRTYTVVMGIIALFIAVLYALSVIHIG